MTGCSAMISSYFVLSYHILSYLSLLQVPKWLLFVPRARTWPTSPFKVIWWTTTLWTAVQRCALRKYNFFPRAWFVTLFYELQSISLVYDLWYILVLQCSWKTFMIHQTFVRWALYSLFKFVKSLIRHLGPAIRNVRHVRWFSWTLVLLEQCSLKSLIYAALFLPICYETRSGSCSAMTYQLIGPGEVC